MPMSSIAACHDHRRRRPAARRHAIEPRDPADAKVSDLVFDGRRVTGVRLVDGAVLHADCVILCAGTYGSPPILMRSGIGPRASRRSASRCARPARRRSEPRRPPRRRGRARLSRAGQRPAPCFHTIATFRSATASASDPPDLDALVRRSAGRSAGLVDRRRAAQAALEGQVRLRSSIRRTRRASTCRACPSRSTSNGWQRGLPARVRRRASRPATTRSRAWRRPAPCDALDASSARRLLGAACRRTCSMGAAEEAPWSMRRAGPRPRAPLRRRRLDHARRAVGLRPPLDDHDRRAPVGRDRRPT